MLRYILLLLALLFVSCNQETTLVVPKFDTATSILSDAKPVPGGSRQKMEGVFVSAKNQFGFGDSLVMKWNGTHPTIFCANATFFILDAGRVGDSVVFEGYWRRAYEYTTGTAQFVILPEEGGREILTQGMTPSQIIIRGVTGSENREFPSRPFQMTWVRPVKKALRSFWILGHRGGGRNSDLHPVSENSVEMIRFSERLGCNGIEIDVRLTKDGVPILFHDENLSTRLVKGDFMVGPVSNFTLDQLNRFTRLVNGEKIPTLLDALTTAVSETQLAFVWLDIKSPEVISTILPILTSIRSLATAQGRDIEIVIGLPTDDIYKAYLEIPEAERGTALCELSLDQVRSVNASVWAPRWTLGTQTASVIEMHGEQRRCFVWTLDASIYIAQFLKESEFDGVLTNYPVVVAYLYYMRS